MRIAYAASEVSPWASTGGLGEVSAALPHALAEIGLDVEVFLPCYRLVRQKVHERGARLYPTGVSTRIPVGTHWLEGQMLRIEPAGPALDRPRAPVYAWDCPQLFDREGIYGFTDEAARFSTFTRAVLDCAPRLPGSEGSALGPPDVFHAHDWHTALAPVYLEGPYRWLLPGTASVLSIHNMGYQGVFPASEMAVAGLGWEWFHPERLEYHGHVGFLKGGIALCDMLSAVSPRYAEEIRTQEFGERLEGLVQAHAGKLRGILNGIDVRAWDPATDSHLAAGFSAADVSGRALCRRQLLERAHLDPDDSHPVFGVVSRLVHQKGFDLVAELVPWLVSRSVRLCLLGQGERAVEEWFLRLQAQFPDHVRVKIGHDPALAHLVYGGSDAILVPSRYEPCGLTQLYAMRYGAVPIVRAVGGLRDTVVPASGNTVESGAATGFCYQHDDVVGLKWACDQALGYYYTKPDLWQRIQRNGMERDFSWTRSAHEYAALYREAVARRRKHGVRY
jgi:starch synthase